MKRLLAVSICAVVLGTLSVAEGESNDDDLALCKGITKAKASLTEGIRQMAKAETPISAKFERCSNTANSLFENG